jgi:hypothetical protein
MEEYEAIFTTELSEADKLKQGFQMITNTIVIQAQHEIELLRAMDDREQLVKQQIKLSTVQHIQGIFEDAYLRATGQRRHNG